MKPDQEKKFSIFCWNIANPSAQRAGIQAQWLKKRQEDILVLTETKRSEGCKFLERYFQAYGYKVIFLHPEENEYGVMIVSKYPLVVSSFCSSMKYLPSRVVSAIVKILDNEFEIIGLYVPSRDASDSKTQKKKKFLEMLSQTLESNPASSKRVFCGDLNILEPDHSPKYPFFEKWEYDFYSSLSQYQLYDTFRYQHPGEQEYSWVGRTNDGYRYDHCFASPDLLSLVHQCYYLHEPRLEKLSDHSALITEFSLDNMQEQGN
jgi:exodeoxyribonuclease-3